MLSLIIPTYFGEHYQLLARGYTVFSGGDPVITTDAAFLFSVITREIPIPVDQWRAVLIRLGIPVPQNFFMSTTSRRSSLRFFSAAICVW